MLAARPVVLPWKTIGGKALLNAETTPEFSMLGSFDCLTQDVSHHILKFLFWEKSLRRRKWQHFWVKHNFPTGQRDTSVSSVAIALQDLNYKIRITQVNTTSNTENLKAGAQTVENKPKFFYILVIPKNILVFFNCRKSVVFSHSWCFYPISVPTFCEEKMFYQCRRNS